jgi:replicative DNA helicase
LAIEIKKIESDKQKIIITGLIVSDEFCKQITPILYKNNKLVSEIFSSFSKIVVNWCIDYFKEYKKSPKKFIQKIYEDKLEEDIYEESDYELISDFLESLSNHYERQENFNEQYIIDQSIKFLREKSLKYLETQIKLLRKQNDIESAEKLINEYREINKDTRNYEIVDFLDDLPDVREAIHKEEDKLFRLSGDLGKLIGYFCRGDLVSFIAPAKRGKSWWLWETAQKALMSKLRVAFFSFEMTKEQVLKRGCQSILGEIKENDEKLDEPKIIKIPYFEWDENKEKYEIEYREREKYGLNFGKAQQKIKAIRKHVKNGSLKIICAPMNSMTTKDISDIIDDMVLDGFVPDVIISDYADITLPQVGGEYRHKLDDVWKGYKNMALSKHCLIVTATHSNKSTFNKDIGEGDASEDIRKMNHVSIMIALDQKKEEKADGVMRVGVIAHRHEDFNPDKKVIVLECKKIGKCYLDSKNYKNVSYRLKEE